MMMMMMMMIPSEEVLLDLLQFATVSGCRWLAGIKLPAACGWFEKNFLGSECIVE